LSLGFQVLYEDLSWLLYCDVRATML